MDPGLTPGVAVNGDFDIIDVLVINSLDIDTTPLTWYDLGNRSANLAILLWGYAISGGQSWSFLGGNLGDPGTLLQYYGGWTGWHFYDAFVGGFNGSLLYGPINELVVEYEVFDNMMNFWGGGQLCFCW